MLSLCKQIIWEWEVLQGRSEAGFVSVGITPSKSIEDSAEKVMKEALERCGITPNKENIEFLDRCLWLLCCERYSDEYNSH